MATPQLSDVARLRAGGFQTLEDLANLVATAMEGLNRQQSSRRGLPDSKFVQVGGGTKIAIDDNSISRKSVSLQPPQTMKYREHGGVGARHQLRADVTTRTVPAVVVEVIGSGADAEIVVVPIGDEPATYVSPSSGQNQSGNPLNNLGFGVDMGGPRYTVRVSGTQFVDSGEGPVAPTVGQTTMVTLSTQSEKVTTWVDRNRQYMPMVSNREGATQAALVNNFCCQEGDGGGGGGS